MATELKAKMGENEKEIPAWIQDHISKAENYISLAAGNYHEYGVNEANTISAPGEWVAYLSMTRGKKLLKTFDTARGAKQFLSKNVDKLLGGANVESVGIMTKKQWDEREAKYAIESVKEDIATELPKASIPSAVKQKLGMAIDKIKDAKLSNIPVSYTHLTLPTKRIV